VTPAGHCQYPTVSLEKSDDFAYLHADSLPDRDSSGDLEPATFPVGIEMWRAQPNSNRLPPQTVSCRVGSRYRLGPRLHKPPCDPGRSDFPSPVLTSAFPRQPSRRRRGSSAGSHPPLPTSICSHARPRLGWPLSPALRPVASRTWNRQVPRAPLPAEGVTSTGATSRAASKGVTPPSSLLRAHAPDHAPPLASCDAWNP